jgi:hypothetical protein
MKQLTSLRLGLPDVSDVGVRALAGLTELQHLDLSGTGVTDEGLKEVAKHRGLTNLSLQGVKNVTDTGVKELAGLPHLKSLVLRATGVTDAGLAELAGCPSLTFLSVMGADKVTDGGVARLKAARPGLEVQR